MAKYLRDGSDWWVSSDADADYRDNLPPGNYVIKKHPMRGFYLEESAPFEIGRVYGDAHRTVDRILRTYVERDRNTGVLAVGVKGTGKTLMTRIVASRAAAELSMPTILVNTPFEGDEFNTFLSEIRQRAVLLFDEFEKVYHEGQEPLLTLLDGVYQSNKLFLLTANSEYTIDAHMISRPGRIFYFLRYGPLDRAFVEEYCLENLENQDQVSLVADVAEVYGSFSFDTLKALVEEMNRYEEDPQTALKYLNIQMDRSEGQSRYEVSVFRDGVQIDDADIDDRSWAINFRTTEIDIEVAVDGRDDDEDKTDWTTLEIRPGNIAGIRDGGRVIHYRDKGFDIVATRKVSVKFDPIVSLANGYAMPGIGY